MGRRWGNNLDGFGGNPFQWRPRATIAMCLKFNWEKSACKYEPGKRNW